MGKDMFQKALLLGALFVVSMQACAAPSPTAKREIARLMDALSHSGCQFQRNGSWYGAAEARAHLQRKYDYLLKKDKVDTAEQFIERAASQSSMSGRAYRVKCQGREQEASAWFGVQLQKLRSTAAPVR